MSLIFFNFFLQIFNFIIGALQNEIIRFVLSAECAVLLTDIVDEDQVHLLANLDQLINRLAQVN